MEKLTLSNPITINGKKVKTLTYDLSLIHISRSSRTTSRPSRLCSTGSAPAKLWASSPVTGERSPERGFFHRLTPGVFAPFLPAPAIFTRRR